MKGKNTNENRLFDNSSPSIFRINWQKAIALKKQKRVVRCCVVLKEYFYQNEIKGMCASLYYIACMPV